MEVTLRALDGCCELNSADDTATLGPRADVRVSIAAIAKLLQIGIKCDLQGLRRALESLIVVAAAVACNMPPANWLRGNMGSTLGCLRADPVWRCDDLPTSSRRRAWG